MYQSESVEHLAFTDRLRLNQIDPVPVKAELKSIQKRMRGINLQAPFFHARQIWVDPILLINLGP